jgi:anion-transporting  ArsA/GET3 family ATPase
MPSLLDRNVIYVTGKGGVGKSTVAAALGLAAAQRGHRTIVCELAAQERMTRLFGRGGVGSGEEVALSENLWSVSIDPQAALREWLATQLGSARLTRLLTASSAFEYFAAAAPGSRELVTITKVWELAQARRWRKGAAGYDVVVVDAPASGHGLGMLRTPRTYGDIARVGPIAKQAERVWELLTDRTRTAYLAVATAAEMPVSETIELEARLRAQIGRELEAVVVNGLYSGRFTRENLGRIAAVAASDGAAGRGALLAARTHAGRARGQHNQLRRLRRHVEAEVTTLPFIFQPELDLDAVEGLAESLDDTL